MSVNISPAQRITLDFVPTVSKILSDHQLDGRQLTLEITEQALVRDADRPWPPCAGCRRSASRSPSTTSAPVTARSRSSSRCRWTLSRSTGGFIRDLGADSDDMAIVRSIIGLARSLGMQLVAEGVETEIAAATLVELGYTRAQGFLFAGPRPAAEIEPMIASGICPPMLDLDNGDTVETPLLPPSGRRPATTGWPCPATWPRAASGRRRRDAGARPAGAGSAPGRRSPETGPASGTLVRIPHCGGRDERLAGRPRRRPAHQVGGRARLVVGAGRPGAAEVAARPPRRSVCR